MYKIQKYFAAILIRIMLIYESVIFYVTFFISFRKVFSIIQSASHINGPVYVKVPNLTSKNLIPKATFTQKGYIQFFKYVVDVPEITDYTFCIWIRSNNLTHNHPVLSYSKDEHQRLIRVWISPHGTHINLELLEIPIFSIRADIVENKWYHICQSWSSNSAVWNLFLNGKLKSNGQHRRLKKAKISSGGDIVVGQEYTDFDKGLDDGIEGDISGFNFVLESTQQQEYGKRNDLVKREVDIQKTGNFQHQLNSSRRKFKKRNDNMLEQTDAFRNKLFPSYSPSSYSFENIIYNSFKNNFNINPVYDRFSFSSSSNALFPLKRLNNNNKSRKSLGQNLIELSSDCSYMRGAPLTGKGVLISWTKTSARVFGGAILKSVEPFCV